MLCVSHDGATPSHYDLHKPWPIIFFEPYL
ncbi:unnamed protein product [Spirodela intermedia]|uniref:Uncharacterized protein n=1 Tax=Spirodela intermedia TaxID=51605 RepID=A0A7I8LP42_SPIIN|nr:unnamed protein product [Spirodela intermedia]